MIIGKNVFKEIFGADPHKRFKGGGGGSPPPTSSIAETELGGYAKGELYPWVESGMAGQGFGPSGAMDIRRTSAAAGLSKSFETAKSDFSSQLSRTIDPTDTRVSSFANQTLNRAYTTAKDQQKRTFAQETIDDKAMSTDMAGTLLANEKRMGVNAAQQYNNALSRNFSNEQQYGTFGTNVAGGLGAGLTDYYFAQKMAT